MKLLLVEDSDADAAFFQAQLEDVAGDAASVRRCSNLEQARKALAEESFDLVLADLNLPDAAGADVVRQLSWMSGHKICVLSGSEDARVVADALAAGACEYLLKSIDQDPQAMWATIQRCTS